MFSKIRARDLESASFRQDENDICDLDNFLDRRAAVICNALTTTVQQTEDIWSARLGPTNRRKATVTLAPGLASALKQQGSNEGSALAPDFAIQQSQQHANARNAEPVRKQEQGAGDLTPMRCATSDLTPNSGRRRSHGGGRAVVTLVERSIQRTNDHF